MLFIGGEKDQIIPPELNEKNAKAYTDKECVTAFKEFSNRGHYICGPPGWGEVASYIYDLVADECKVAAPGYCLIFDVVLFKVYVLKTQIKRL